MKAFARVSTVALVAAVALFALSGDPAQAAVRFNVDVLWNPNPDDDSQVFLHVTNMAYPMPREQVTAVFHQIPNPYEDYPVLAFIAYHGHVDINTVWSYRRKDHSWPQIMFHFGVAPSALFFDLPSPPGPPYGKAYGHWRKRGDGMPRDAISADDIRYWVRMRAVANYAGVAPRQVYEWKRSGQRFETMASRQYHAKHAKGKGAHDGPGKGWGKSKGH